VWICGNNGKIYKQFSGVGSYVDQEQIARNWKGITVNLTNGTFMLQCLVEYTF
jgi:hypothetical protein